MEAESDSEIDVFYNMVQAILQNDLNKVKNAHPPNFSVNKSLNGETLLSIAIRFRNPEIIKYIIQLGASTNLKSYLASRTPGGPYSQIYEPPIITALRIDTSCKILKMLIDNEADLSATDDIGMTPLWIASIKGRPDYVNLLLQSQSPINFPHYYNNPLCILTHFLGFHIGVRMNNNPPHQREISIWSKNNTTYTFRKIISNLITAGLSHECRDTYYNETPICWTIKYADLGLTKLLLETGTRLNPDNFWSQPENLPLDWQRQPKILNWFYSEITSPGPLKRLCRTYIRRVIKNRTNKDLRLSLTKTQLPNLPKTLLNYLQLTQVKQEAESIEPSTPWGEIIVSQPWLIPKPDTGLQLQSPWTEPQNKVNSKYLCYPPQYNRHTEKPNPVCLPRYENPPEQDELPNERIYF